MYVFMSKVIWRADELVFEIAVYYVQTVKFLHKQYTETSL